MDQWGYDSEREIRDRAKKSKLICNEYYTLIGLLLRPPVQEENEKKKIPNC